MGLRYENESWRQVINVWRFLYESGAGFVKDPKYQMCEISGFCPDVVKAFVVVGC
jgi:hypothetical protein